MKKNTKIVDPLNYPYNDDPFIIQNKSKSSKKACDKQEEILKWTITFDHEMQEVALRIESRIIFLQWIASVSIVLSALTVLFVGLHK
jgi:hypothetical protein